jgi:diguanylate cyclase (GGDEF)-like protein
MMTTLEKEVKRAQRFNREVSVLMMDIDYFKSFNDEFGHIVGDRVLRKIGRILKRKTRKIDTVARYGGEEFVAILPNTTHTQAFEVAEKLRNGISTAHYPEISSHSKSLITVSIGIATCPGDADDHEKLIHAADTALYKAKKRGRNQVAYSNVPDAPAQA